MKTSYAHRPVSDHPRDVEAWGLTEAARRLVAAQQTPGDEAALRQALSLNQRLWTIFQASMADPACPLPQEVRENVLALSIIVDRITLDRLMDLDATKLDRLVEINRAIAAGLSQRPAGEAPAPRPVAPPAATPGPLRVSA